MRCVVVEEGDPFLAEPCAPPASRSRPRPAVPLRRAQRGKGAAHPRPRRSPEPELPRGKPPQLCEACPYHPVYGTLRKLDCIVAGDIGCYTLGVLPPYQAMDTCVAMGASLGVGLGLRHVLPRGRRQEGGVDHRRLHLRPLRQ